MRNKAWNRLWGITAAAVLMAGSVMSGCGSTNQEAKATPESAVSPETVSEPAESTAAETQEKGTGDRKLEVYSNTDEAGAKAMEDVGKEIGITVTVVRLNGGGEVTDRIMAEKNNPTADIVYGINHIGFARLKAADCLQPFTPEWNDKVENGLKDPDGYYYGVGISAILLAYNPEAVGENVPSDWTDLWTKPEWKGKYFVNPSTSGGTTQLVLSGILNRYRDDNGELGISEEGWDAVAAYYQNAYIQQEGDDFFAMLTKGDVWAGQNYSKGVLKAEEDYNAQIAWATPEVGVPFAVEMVGIVNGSKNLDAAKEFLDYYGSAEVMQEISTTYPANEDARGKVDPKMKELTDSVKVQDIDYDFVAENLDSWLEKIELELIP